MRIMSIYPEPIAVSGCVCSFQFSWLNIQTEQHARIFATLICNARSGPPFKHLCAHLNARQQQNHMVGIKNEREYKSAEGLGKGS